MTRLCGDCRTSIEDRPKQATYCLACAAKHIRKQRARKAKRKYNAMTEEQRRAYIKRHNAAQARRRGKQCAVLFEKCQAEGCDGWFRQTGPGKFCAACRQAFFPSQVKYAKRKRRAA